jgi:hypothetical protein
MTAVTSKNYLDYIIRYEDGQLSDDEFVGLFQYLVNCGKAWKLQGHYGRVAHVLIEQGIITDPYADSDLDYIPEYVPELDGVYEGDSSDTERNAIASDLARGDY